VISHKCGCQELAHGDTMCPMEGGDPLFQAFQAIEVELNA